MGAIVGDVVHNLRSALDVLISQLYETGTGFKAPRHLAFPIDDTRHDFESRSLREVERASKDAVEILKGFKPYKLGNPSLWILQQLNNRDKHHVLTPVFSALRIIKMDFVSAIIGPMSAMFSPQLREEFQKLAPASPITYIPGPPQAFCPLKHDTVLLRLPISIANQLHKYTEFTFDIAFGEGEIVQAQSVMPVLQKLLGMVEGIVQAFAMLTIPAKTR
jgi:hypothetical protein